MKISKKEEREKNMAFAFSSTFAAFILLIKNRVKGAPSSLQRTGWRCIHDSRRWAL